MKVLTSQQIAKRWSLIYPLNGSRSQGFGENRVDIYKQLGLKGHNGIDLAAPLGTPVYFPCDLTVMQIWPDERPGGGYGIHIRCRTQNISFIEGTDWSGEFYLEVILGHFSEIDPSIKVGDKVSRKQLAGKCGCTGACTGPHCHLEIRPFYKLIVDFTEVWKSDVGNGYGGAVDPEPLLRYEPLDVERFYTQFDGRLIKSTDSPKVYLLKDKQKRWFPNEEILWSHGYILWGTGEREIIKLGPLEINQIPEGKPMERGPYWDFLQDIKAELTNYIKRK